jgi:hypothetical protein
MAISGSLTPQQPLATVEESPGPKSKDKPPA